MFLLVLFIFYFFFFFSSRRRHTRYWRDWSSDVCSSDLLLIVGPPAPVTVSPRSYRVRLTAFATLSLLALSAGGMAASSFSPAHLDAEGDIVGNRSVVVLQPKTWVGQRFPLLKHIDLGNQ